MSPICYIFVKSSMKAYDFTPYLLSFHRQQWLMMLCVFVKSVRAIQLLYRSMRCIISHLFWEEPSSFRPERFADPKKASRYSYFPFGDGPMIFMGASFAVQQAFTILATLLKHDRFAHFKGHETSPEITLTLRPERGVCLMTDPIDTTNSTA